MFAALIALVFAGPTIVLPHVLPQPAPAQQPQQQRGRSAKKSGSVAPPHYQSWVKRWHTPAANETPPADPAGRPTLVVYSLNTNDRVELAPGSDRGGFAAHDLDRLAHALRESWSGNEHPVDPRLADLVYRIQTHFHAQEIRVISGYRTPHRHRASNHGLGRAIDIIVPGATDTEVATFARGLGFVGVGVYPTSGFVHVDVRSRSYFWVDRSGPGRRNRERGVLGDVASKSDAEALARGERPTPPYAIGTDVDAWLRAHPAGAAQPSSSSPDDDEEDMETDDSSSAGAPSS